MDRKREGIEQEVLEESQKYQRTQMQKNMILERLRERGCRITKQRRIILDIILENECSSCKEIFYRAVKTDNKIGSATVYRMINILEEIGAISRKNMYKVSGTDYNFLTDGCVVILDDDTIYHLSAQKWDSVLEAGLSACGYLKNQKIASVRANIPASGV